MSNRNNNANFKIPTIFIILAWIYCWPIGLILTILRGASSSSESKASRTSDVQKNNGRKKSEARDFVEVNKTKIKRKTSLKTKIATACSVLSLLFTGYVGLAFAANGFVNFYTGLFGMSIVPLLLLSGLLTGGCFIAREIFAKEDAHFNKLRTIIGNRESINLTKLAAASGKDLRKIRKDVQKLIDKGEYGDSAYIDIGTNNFMKYPYAQPDEPEAFDYRTVYGDLFKKDKKDKREKNQDAPDADVKTNADDGDTTTIEDSGDFAQIISEIRRLNDEIKDAEVSDRIYKIETHTKNIFEYVTDHPEAMPQIRTFMNYYLPTTLKLLESYSRIERVGVAGENMKKSKADIENILDLLSVGFEQQIDQLFKNEYIDISSDISVLEKMMQKDGLSGKNDFDIMSYVDEVSDDITDSGTAAMEMPDDKK